MHIAIAVGALLLGGWVLNSPVDDDQSAVQEPSQPSGTTPAVLPDRSDAQNRDDRGMGRNGGDRAAGGRPMSSGQPGHMQQRQRPLGMPSAPTDSTPAGAAGVTGQPMAPTSGVMPSQSSGGGAEDQSFGSRQPMAPTERYGEGSQSASQSGYHPTSSGMTDSDHHMPALSSPPVTAPPVVAEKAFSGYRPPSGVSPYMNLFRANAGGVDNYSTLVRPELDQRFLNHQLGNDIRGLQNNTRTQGMNLQQLNKDARTLQGVATPQYYQNYGNYYQGYGQ